MEAFTYQTLSDAIELWMEENSVEMQEDAMPIIIGLAEQRLLTDLHLSTFDAVLPTATVSSQRTLAKPTGMVQCNTMSLVINGKRERLEQRTHSYLEDWETASQATGQPVMYADQDDENWILSPVPDNVYTVEVYAIVRPDGLVPASPNGSSWLATNVPQLLFYACAVEAEGYLKADLNNPDRATKWLNNYNSGLETTRVEMRRWMRESYFPMAVNQGGAASGGG